MRSPSTPWSLMIGLMVVHPVSVFLWHGMISGQWGELVLFEGMGMKFKDKIVLQGCREEYFEYGPATGILCWEYDVTGESYLTRLSGLMNSKADCCSGDPWSFLRRIGAEVEDLILFFGWLGVFYLLVGGWWWHGAMPCVGPAEISPNLFCEKHEWTLLD